jgi:hypothetical protein
MMEPTWGRGSKEQNFIYSDRERVATAMKTPYSENCLKYKSALPSFAGTGGFCAVIQHL